MKRPKTGQRWGLKASSRARILAGKSVSSSSTNGKTTLKEAPHINDCMSGRVGNLTTYSIRLRCLERRQPDATPGSFRATQSGNGVLPTPLFKQRVVGGTRIKCSRNPLLHHLAETGERHCTSYVSRLTLSITPD